MPSPARTAETPVTLAVPGADLCLDFANTRYWRGSPEPTEQLATPADFLVWVTTAGGLPPALAPLIERAWKDNPRQATATFGRALALREAIYRQLAALALESKPRPEDLVAINDALARAPARNHLVPTAEGYGWSVASFAPRAACLLAPVLWSVGDLLAAPRRLHVRCCSNEKCRWVFVDDSRAGTRRWCNMSACGNRAKAQRHYIRHKRA